MTALMPTPSAGNPGHPAAQPPRVPAASAELSRDLQRVLVDLVELHLQAKQAHWNVLGPNFRDLHLQLDEVTDAAREAGDAIAERLRALRGTPDGRSVTVAGTTTLAVFPQGERPGAEMAAEIADRIAAAVATVRAVHDAVDAEDPATSDLLHAVVVSLEKQAWMLRAEISAT